MHRHENDLPSEYNEGESAVTPMEVDKSLIDENLNAQNKPEEEKAEHVHVTSPCCSHIITEMEEGPGQAITEAGTSVKNVVADKSDAEHCLTQDPKDPEAENQGHFAVATEVNQGTDSSLQGDGQEEQLNNAHATDAEHLGNLTGSTDSDLPAPEKVLAAPNRLGDENGFMVESTPDKEDTGTCNEDAGNNNITGEKTHFYGEHPDCRKSELC